MCNDRYFAAIIRHRCFSVPLTVPNLGFSRLSRPSLVKNLRIHNMECEKAYFYLSYVIAFIYYNFYNLLRCNNCKCKLN